ncbi:hypothetical protein G6F22_017726 [Rhizopus arrhizus]|nr:hypothetical protein G6F22_017726 [Rhizopus arrhizus]
MQVQQEQAGDAEHQAGHGEQVQEPAPRRAGIAALVQVVEVGHRAARGIAAGARQRQVDLLGRPLGRASANGDAQLGVQPLPGRARDRRVTVLARAQLAQQLARQFQVLVLHLGLGLDLRRMVEGQAGHREQQHADQAHRRADPVPLVQQ